MVDPERTRDLFVVAALFGAFGFAWSGWGQEDPPRRWRPWLGVLSVLSLLLAVAGGVLSWSAWSSPTSVDGPAAGWFFGAVVGAELLLGLLGSLVLHRRGRPERIAPWISLVVGVHFLPLVALFDNWTLLLPAAVLVVSALLAVRAHRLRGRRPSAVTGLLNAPALLLTGVGNLLVGLLA
ncbi:hypothetical protein [Auraticoccus monumenti]|uniref:Uncharacterized protein n=1 Tax=Auraticoccus monumenti TaxID=675864 RepID=A0A1G6W0L5_9ACTN|nr:hypothetical protein [Auraticoccus monumenti]SDD58606.1 hypothetical protein SAMN04489747_1291 [Auraticoccus monumenti]